MQSNNLKLNQVSTLESLPDRCGTKKRIVEDVKHNLFQIGSPFTTTCIPRFVKSCKEEIMFRNYIDKTGKNLKILIYVLEIFSDLHTSSKKKLYTIIS